VARPDAGVVQPVLPGHRPTRPGRGDGSRGVDVRDHLRTPCPHGYHQLSGSGLGAQPAVIRPSITATCRPPARAASSRSSGSY
jgi:hypothetical protein